MGSDHGVSWVLQYRINPEGGREDFSRRWTCHNQICMSERSFLATVRWMDWREGETRDKEIS